MNLLFCTFIFSSLSLFAGTQALSERVYQIRDPKTDSAHFRQALEKIGEQLGYAVLEELNTKEVRIETLTGIEAQHTLLDEAPVLVTVLRAGLPLNAGVHNVFPNAEVGFLAMSRHEETLKAEVDYVALPNLSNRSVIITDTMVATGGSLIDAIELVKEKLPRRIFVIAAIASKPGIERILNQYPDIKIYSAVIDPALNEKGYIIPGLGDAGDRSYGNKQH
jgi:uracil phosphoribosyltransferase